MKRILSLLLAAVLLVGSLSGCEALLTPAESTPSTSNTPSNPGTGPNGTTPNQTDPSVNAQGGNVTINEVMPDNKKLCLGHELDWIELYNAEDHSISLDGYYLADNPENLTELPLAGLEIPANGYLVITLDDDSSFRLSSNGETVYLIRAGEIISQLTFGLADDGESFDAAGACPRPTPGFANTDDGHVAYLESQTLPGLIISEVMSSNSKYLPVKGEYYDLVEIRNNSDQPIDLSAYTLSDKRSEPARYSFPAVTLQPGEYYIVYCSGNTALGKDHTSFKLSSDGETVYLSMNGTLSDVLTIPGDLQKNESYGRFGKIPMYMNPTFGKDNTSGHLTGVAAPNASLPSGLYDDAVTITLSGDGDIYYTTDGSRPTTSSKRYSEPIAVDGVTTIRAFLVNEGRTSNTVSYTYVIGQTHDLPVVIISIPGDSLNGDKGVLNHPEVTYEYEAVVTMIEDGEEKFSVPFGFRLHGNDSRKCKKQNFQLRFRSEYGPSKLNYPLFDDLEFDSYDSLLLKGGSEDWYGSIIKDELATSIASTTNVYTQAIKPVVLYLGGEYWGVYFLRERFNDDYVASHLNVSENSVDILESNGAYVESGSNKEYLALRKYCQNNDMSLEKNYDYLCSQIDVLSLMDWYICRTYMGDKDIANIRRFRSKEYDGLWRWMFFDMDWSFYHTTDDPFTSIMSKTGADKILMQAVLSSEKGRDTFLKRYAELMDTTLNETYIISVIDSLASQIDSEMTRDRERWGYSYEHWQGRIQKLRNYVANNARTNNVLRDLKDYFDLSDSEMEYYFG